MHGYSWIFVFLYSSFNRTAPIANPHPDAHQGLKGRPPVDEKVLVPLNPVFFKQHNNRRTTYTTRSEREDVKSRDHRRTKGKIPELLPPLHIISLIHRRLDTPHHHRANAHRHHPPEMRAVDGHDLAYVFPIHIERASDGLRCVLVR